MNTFVKNYSVMYGSVMNVVCYVGVCHECGL